jgi:PadR family transcriptional regulator, regulatory protein AphA
VSRAPVRGAPGAPQAHRAIASGSSRAEAPVAAEAERLGPTALGILGLVQFGPVSGYDIKQIADRSLQFFFSMGYGQIYPRLGELERSGYIELADDDGERSRRRRKYRITHTGRAVLEAWLHVDAEPTRLRSDTIAKLMLAGPLDPERAREILAEYRTWTERRLDVVRFNREAVPDPPPNIEAAISWGEALLTAELAWCDHATELFSP